MRWITISGVALLLSGLIVARYGMNTLEADGPCNRVLDANALSPPRDRLLAWVVDSTGPTYARSTAETLGYSSAVSSGSLRSLGRELLVRTQRREHRGRQSECEGFVAYSPRPVRLCLGAFSARVLPRPSCQEYCGWSAVRPT